MLHVEQPARRVGEAEPSVGETNLDGRIGRGCPPPWSRRRAARSPRTGSSRVATPRRRSRTRRSRRRRPREVRATLVAPRRSACARLRPRGRSSRWQPAPDPVAGATPTTIARTVPPWPS
jgi:hypothetical protein